MFNADLAFGFCLALVKKVGSEVRGMLIQKDFRGFSEVRVDLGEISDPAFV